MPHHLLGHPDHAFSTVRCSLPHIKQMFFFSSFSSHNLSRFSLSLHLLGISFNLKYPSWQMFSWKTVSAETFQFLIFLLRCIFWGIGGAGGQVGDEILIQSVPPLQHSGKHSQLTMVAASPSSSKRWLLIDFFLSHIFLSSSSFSRQGNRSSIAFNGNSWVPSTPPTSINIFQVFLTDIFESLLLNIDKKTFISILIPLLIFTAGSSIVFNGNSWVPSPSL